MLLAAAGPTREHPETTGAYRDASVMPHPGQPYPTLVNRGEPGRYRITVINIRDHLGYLGQPAWYCNEKHFPGRSRCLPGAIPKQKHREGSGTGHESFKHFKTFFEHPGTSRMPKVIPDHPGVGQVHFPGDPGLPRLGIRGSPEPPGRLNRTV